MISDILTITDRIYGLLKQTKEGKKELFEKIIDPMFSDLTIVQNNYIYIFTEVEKSIQDPLVKIMDVVISLRDQGNIYRQKRQTLIDLSFELDRLKFNLPNAEFLPFINAVVGYFTSIDGLVFPQPKTLVSLLDRYLKTIAEHQNVSSLDSTDLIAVRRIVRRIIDHLNEDWSLITKEYAHLKLIIYRRKF